MSAPAVVASEASAGWQAPCVVVLGPTACGKTRLAVGLARRFGGEIVSADSRQVYRGLDIGTGKDLVEYGSGADQVRHHLIDCVEPWEDYHLFRFLRDARSAIADIASRGRLAIVAGGSALYINALLDGYGLDGAAPNPALRGDLDGLSDEQLQAVLEREAPDLAVRADTTQRRRLVRAVEIARSRGAVAGLLPQMPYRRSLLLGPYYPRATIHERIAQRLAARLQGGLIEEVTRLHERGLPWPRLEWYGLEYRYVALHVQGKLSLDEMRQTLLARIRRFCRSQDIWFRKMEREGKIIHWLPEGDLEQAAGLVQRFLAGAGMPLPTLRLSEICYGPRSSR